VEKLDLGSGTESVQSLAESALELVKTQLAEDYASPVGGRACPDASRSETPTVVAWVPSSGEGDDVEVKGFALQVTGSHLLVRPCLLRSPLDESLPSGLRFRSVSIRPCCQGVPHRPPNCFVFLMP
jgi:hypothetical protein